MKLEAITKVIQDNFLFILLGVGFGLLTLAMMLTLVTDYLARTKREGYQENLNRKCYDEIEVRHMCREMENIKITPEGRLSYTCVAH